MKCTMCRKSYRRKNGKKPIKRQPSFCHKPCTSKKFNSRQHSQQEKWGY